MFIVYDDKGMIRYTIGGPDPEQHGKFLTANGELWLFDATFEGDIADKYVAKGKIRARPKMSIGRSGKAFTGVPKGCVAKVMFQGDVVATETVNDGRIDLTTVTPGTYQIALDCWPYMPKTVEITL